MARGKVLCGKRWTPDCLPGAKPRHSTAIPVGAARPDSPTRALLLAPLRALLRPLADGLHLGEHMMAGAAATGVAVAVMHPLDTIKTVSQAGGTSALAAARSRMADGRGLLALYGGVGPSVGGQMPAGSIKLAAFEGVSQWARRACPDINSNVIELASAAVAFLACSVVLVPGEVIKQKVQAGLFKSTRAGVRGIMAVDGIAGFFAGYQATLLRDVPYTMLEFGLFAQFKRMLRAFASRPAFTSKEEWAMGGLAGGCTGLLTTPLDLAKTKLMTQPRPLPGGKPMYSGVIDVFVKIAKEEGVSGLFRGGATRVAWLVPFTAVFFGVHGMSKRVLLERKTAKAAGGRNVAVVHSANAPPRKTAHRFSSVKARAASSHA
jgi:solute carrier family 25 (mitochondrial S-adenosylmethionine transporter), member 26